MRAPAPWPYDSENTWRAWRNHLDQPLPEPVPHIAMLRLQAEHELHRIARCRPEPPQTPSKPVLVPQLNEHRPAPQHETPAG
jgi:hypothetical protein